MQTSFKQYLLEELTVRPYTGTSGFYAFVQPTKQSVRDIVKQFPSLSFTKKEKDDLHCTIMYSKTPLTIDTVPSPDTGFSKKIHVKELAWWPGHKDDGVLVLKLHAGYLNDLHNRWKGAGAIPTYPDYEPHITLKTPIAYDDCKHLLDTDLSHMTIVLENERISDLS